MDKKLFNDACLFISDQAKCLVLINDINDHQKYAFKCLENGKFWTRDRGHPRADLDIKNPITTREVFSLKGILLIAVLSITTL